MESSAVTKSPPAFWSGVALMVIGSVLLSAKGIMAKILFAEGLDYQEVITFRSLMALPLFWLWGIYTVGLKKILQVDGRSLSGAVGAGFFCYFIGGSADFYALTLIDAGLERVLLYTYPAIIVIAFSAWKRQLPAQNVLLALLMTYTGVVLAIGVIDVNLRQANTLGSTLVLFCAFTYAAYYVVNDIVGQKVGSVVFTVYAMTAATVAISVRYGLTHTLLDFEFTSKVIGSFSILVVFVTVVPLFMLAEGVKQIGAQRAALVSTVGPASTIILAALILGESMRWFQYCGIAITLLGVMVLEWRQSQAAVVQES